jgi:hypothetical protein
MILFRTFNYSEIVKAWTEYLGTGKFNKGDAPVKQAKGSEYLLIQNDEEYLDTEYRVLVLSDIRALGEITND